MASRPNQDLSSTPLLLTLALMVATEWQTTSPVDEGGLPPQLAQGGHNVPEAVIRRRFEQGWRNFLEVYRRLVNPWRVYDNSGARLPTREVADSRCAGAK